MNPLASFFSISIIAYDQKKDTWKSANRTLFRLLSVYIIVVALLLLSLLQACRSQGANSPPNFGGSFNPISTRRGRLCPPHYFTTGTPRISDLPMALVHLLLPIPFCDQPLVALLVSLLLSRDITLSIGGIGLTKVSIPLS